MAKVWARRGLREGCASGLALSAAAALWLGCAGAPAWAGDDGAAPIWDSLGSVINWGGEKDQRTINYRDRPRLVLPKTVELPPPAAAPAASATNWPRDPDVEALKAEQAEKKKVRTAAVMDPANAAKQPKSPDPNTVITTSYTAGMGVGARRCVAGPGDSCDVATRPAINWNPLTWVGLEKKPATVLGPEPDRTSLTDPPVGYRAPVEGVGAKIDNN